MIAFTLLQLYLAFVALPFVRATIFVTAPLNTTTCRAGQACLVQWVDNGAAPLLSTIGPCFVGLYNGQDRLIQQIEPVDVASVHSFQFTPDPAAGPNSEFYYINFTSVKPIGNPPLPYTQYSPFFTLADMTGSFASPVASDTSTLAVPSTVASPPAQSVSSTIVISHSSSPSSSSAASTKPPSSSATSTAPPSSSATGSASSSGSSSSMITSRVPSSSSSGSSSLSSSSIAPTHAAASSASLSIPMASSTSCVFLLLGGIAMLIAF